MSDIDAMETQKRDFPFMQNKVLGGEKSPPERSQNMNTYWCVTTSIDDRGKIISRITATKEAARKPENSCTSAARRDVYTDWFESYEAAQNFVEEAENA